MKFDSDNDIDNDDDYVTLSLEVLCKKAKMMNQILLEGERSFLRTRFCHNSSVALCNLQIMHDL